MGRSARSQLSQALVAESRPSSSESIALKINAARFLRDRFRGWNLESSITDCRTLRQKFTGGYTGWEKLFDGTSILVDYCRAFNTFDLDSPGFWVMGATATTGRPDVWLSNPKRSVTQLFDTGYLNSLYWIVMSE